MGNKKINSDMEDDSSQLYKKIMVSTPGEEPIEDTLSTDERVFARITDGIYREPASAIRELISNAYDADATKVIISTDFPRFSRISIKDNGSGLTERSVARLIKHIGGSSKRTNIGIEVGTVSEHDPTRSPDGRKLIGKIGIGLFAVSQLTSKFKLITKRKGDEFYIIVDVKLAQYSEDDREGDFKSGSVKIYKEKTDNVLEHGTEIILKELKSASRRELSSFNLWERVGVELDIDPKIDMETYATEDFKEEITTPPKFHVGRIDTLNDEYIKESSNLPWDSNDKPEEKFAKLVNSVIEEQVRSTANPSISNLLDNYLQTIWNLSLSAPLEYLDFNPWNKERLEGFRYFHLSNKTKKQAVEIEDDFLTITEKIKTSKPKNLSETPFEVYFDDQGMIKL